MTFGVARTVAVLLASLTAFTGRQGVDDPALRAAVEQFFAAQQAEDVNAYLALWSASVRPPTPEQLKYVFDAGDDTYSEIAILATYPASDRVRVRVRATRDRTTPSRVPGRPPFTFHSTTSWSLVYVRENGDWKLVREGPAVDALADGLIAAATMEEREALLQAEPDLVTLELILALSRRAGQAAQEQKYAQAQVGFERMREVARRVGDKRYEGEALQNLANALYFQRNLAGALDAYEQRLTIERGREDQAGIAAALIGIGTIRYTFAEYGTALTTYRQALEIQERMSDEAGLATTLISTGNIFYLQGEFGAAIADYMRSRDLARRMSNAAGEADALEGLARVYIAQGDYASALEALASVLADGKARNDRNDQATALLSIGDVHFRLGNFDSARTALVESRAHFEAIKDLSHVGRVWQAIALVDLVSNRFALAEDEYKKGADICAKAADGDCAAAATAGLAFALDGAGEVRRRDRVVHQGGGCVHATWQDGTRGTRRRRSLSRAGGKRRLRGRTGGGQSRARRSGEAGERRRPVARTDCRGRGAASPARAPEGPRRGKPRRRGCRPSRCRRRREALSGSGARFVGRIRDAGAAPGRGWRRCRSVRDG